MTHVREGRTPKRMKIGGRAPPKRAISAPGVGIAPPEASSAPRDVARKLFPLP